MPEGVNLTDVACAQCRRLESDREHYAHALTVIAVFLNAARESEDTAQYARLRAEWHAIRRGLETADIETARHRAEHDPNAQRDFESCPPGDPNA
jgi:hypothetical protein